MKVLMTADCVGGVWTYALELTRALRRRGVSISLATMGALPSAEQRDEARAAGVEELLASEFGLEWMLDRRQELGGAGEWLLEARDQTRPDVVHLNGYVHAALPSETPVVVAAHSCVLSWFEAVRHAPAPLEWRAYADDVERGLRAASLVVAPTRAMLDALRRHYRFETPALVVHNGRTALAPAPKEPLVLAAGRAWDEAKNVAALERVAPRLPWPVRIAGHGSRDGAVSRTELDALFGRAAIFALPARYEPFGLAALEAAQASCALVLGDIASLREVWGDAAAFVPPGDDDALAETLLRLTHDDAARAELAARAHKRARRYTPEAMADGYLRAYERLVASDLEAVA